MKNNPFETNLRAFHSNANLKSQMLKEIAKHRKADAILQGTYSEDSSNAVGMKGCAIGCSLHSLGNIKGKEFPLDVHELYETELGIPRSLARLEDTVFEGLSVRSAKRWPGEFLEAIPVGADLSLVLPRFLVWLLADEADGIIKFARNDQEKQAIQAVADLYQGVIDGKTIGTQDWKDAAAYAAANAAYAAYAAANAAYAAYAAANAAYAAYAAANAAYAAALAAVAAANAAYAAARKTHFEKIASQLLSLMHDAPVPQAELTAV